MPNRPSLFGANSSRDLFAVSASGSSVGATYGEVKLREEFDDLLFGFTSGIRHGHLIVVRNMRRDSEGEPVVCTCKQELSTDADPDCVYCQGEGFLWDESWHWTYSMYSGSDTGLANRVVRMPYGLMRIDYRVFYVRFDTDIKYGDKIIEMKLDDEGSPVVPYIRESIYMPQTIQKYRSDNGRVEYIAVACREDSAIRSDTPV